MAMVEPSFFYIGLIAVVIGAGNPMLGLKLALSLGMSL